MDVEEILWTTLLYLEEGGKLSNLCEKAVKKQLKDTNLSPEGKYYFIPNSKDHLVSMLFHWICVCLIFFRNV